MKMFTLMSREAQEEQARRILEGPRAAQIADLNQRQEALLATIRRTSPPLDGQKDGLRQLSGKNAYWRGRHVADMTEAEAKAALVQAIAHFVAIHGGPHE